MFRKIIATILLSIAVILPWRLRSLYIEALGWIVQFFYMSYFVILKFILKELQKAQMEGKKDGA